MGRPLRGSRIHAAGTGLASRSCRCLGLEQARAGSSSSGASGSQIQAAARRTTRPSVSDGHRHSVHAEQSALTGDMATIFTPALLPFLLLSPLAFTPSGAFGIRWLSDSTQPPVRRAKSGACLIWQLLRLFRLRRFAEVTTRSRLSHLLHGGEWRELAR